MRLIATFGPPRTSSASWSFALRAAPMLRGGVDPAFLDEVSWWRTDDLWFWSLQALVTYVRAAAQRAGVDVAAMCVELAQRHGIELAVAPR